MDQFKRFSDLFWIRLIKEGSVEWKVKVLYTRKVCYLLYRGWCSRTNVRSTLLSRNEQLLCKCLSCQFALLWVSGPYLQWMFQMFSIVDDTTFFSLGDVNLVKNTDWNLICVALIRMVVHLIKSEGVCQRQDKLVMWNILSKYVFISIGCFFLVRSKNCHNFYEFCKKFPILEYFQLRNWSLSQTFFLSL